MKLEPYSNYATIRKHITSVGGGGLITLVHHLIRENKLESLFPHDPHLEHQAVVIEVDGVELRVINI